jgi:antitoxin component YwqK of YwqJK toxin-antitoxin module
MKEHADEGATYEIEIAYWLDIGHPHSSNQLEPYCRGITQLDENGKKHGVEVRRLLPGRRKRIQTQRVTQFKHGVKHGTEEVYQTGTLKSRLPWVNGQIQGTKKVFFASRGKEDKIIQMKAPYVDGKKHGKSKTFSKDGTLIRTEEFKNGKKHGLRIDYDEETGNVIRKISYEKGQVVGTAKEFYPNGNMKKTISTKNGHLHGPTITYDSEGNKTNTEYYLSNKKVSKFEYTQTVNKE